MAQLLGTPVHFCGTGREAAEPLVRAAYGARAPIVGVCAAGALIRLIGPDLGAKAGEPPVVAVSADGKVAVPLLGVHRGANALARWIADGFGGVAGVTSLSDSLYDFSLEDPPPGYRIANREAVRPLMAALLKGERLKVAGPSGWLSLAGYPVDPAGSQVLTVTEHALGGAGLVIHPQTLVAGVGCASKADAAEVVGLIEEALGSAGLAPESLGAIASYERLAGHAALDGAAHHFGVPLRVFSKRALEKEFPRLASASRGVKDATGLSGVCEAAALKAGSLLVQKRKSAHATCAIGRAETPIDPQRFGKAP